MTKNSKVSAILAILFGVLLLFIISIGIYVHQNMKPVSEVSHKKIISIPLGASSKEIAVILKQNGLVKDSNVFYYYMKYKHVVGLHAGKYLLDTNMNFDQLLYPLEKGKVYIDTVKVTIPEGFTVDQIGQLLQDKKLVTKQEFINAVNYGNYNNIWFLNNIPQRPDVKYKLEGFLFPKTYMFKKGESAENIVKTLLEQTAKEFPLEWINELKKNNISFYDAFTLASIIEREAEVDSERPIIAEVYYNRIKKGMKLQADATIQYALGKQKPRLLYSDLALDSKYNTYKYQGFPPGPIANPGIASLKAVVFPDKNNYLFYVAKNDGTGGHYFSETYNGHQKYIAISEKAAK